MAQDTDILQLDPEDQLSIFSRSSLMQTVIISVLIHIVIIGASWGAKHLSPPKEIVVEPVTTPLEESTATAPTEATTPVATTPDDGQPSTGQGTDTGKDTGKEPGKGKEPDLKNSDLKNRFEETKDPVVDPTDPFNSD